MEPSTIVRLVLASASPRRMSLLSEAGYDFLIHPSEIDERALEKPGMLPADLAMRLALAKSEVVADQFPNDVVLAADTVVAFGDRSLGQPADAIAARNMLRLLESTTHLVITAVSVVHLATGHRATGRVMSAVRMRPLTAHQIDDYIHTDLWRGKAGGYGIQDNDPFVERLTGCHTNIVGLPMTTTARLLKEAGILPAPRA
jgi:nucleoside triphosphate pyrophosphatase